MHIVNRKLRKCNGKICLLGYRQKICHSYDLEFRNCAL